MNDRFALFCADKSILSGVTPCYALGTGNEIDLETYAAADQQVFGWLNIRFSNDAEPSGGNEGLDISIHTDDTDKMASPRVIQTLHLTQGEVAAGKIYTMGVCFQPMEKLMDVYIAATSTEFGGTLNVTISLDSYPMTNKVHQANLAIS